jgi:hypothetical protein
MIVKFGIAGLLLGFVLLSITVHILGAVAHMLHLQVGFPTRSRPFGGGDYLAFGIVFTLISMVGFGALRGARAISRELGEPDPPLPDGPPGHRWNSPVVEVNQSDSLADGTPVSNPNEVGGSIRSDPGFSTGKMLIRIGHAIAILTLVIVVYAMFFLREGGGIALGFVLALFFYVAGAAVNLLDE